MDDCLERCSDIKVEIAALELLMGQKRSRGLPEVHPDACKKEERQDFRDL